MVAFGFRGGNLFETGSKAVFPLEDVKALSPFRKKRWSWINKHLNPIQ